MVLAIKPPLQGHFAVAVPLPGNSLLRYLHVLGRWGCSIQLVLLYCHTGRQSGCCRHIANCAAQSGALVWRLLLRLSACHASAPCVGKLVVSEGECLVFICRVIAKAMMLLLSLPVEALSAHSRMVWLQHLQTRCSEGVSGANC